METHVSFKNCTGYMEFAACRVGLSTVTICFGVRLSVRLFFVDMATGEASETVPVLTLKTTLFCMFVQTCTITLQPYRKTVFVIACNVIFDVKMCS